MDTTKNLPADDIDFLIDLADGNDTNGDADFARLRQIKSALADTDLPAGVEVTAPEGRAWLLSARDLDHNDKPIRIFYTEWEIDLIISISRDADEYGVGPRMVKTELPTGLRIDTI